MEVLVSCTLSRMASAAFHVHRYWPDPHLSVVQNVERSTRLPFHSLVMTRSAYKADHGGTAH